jgi:hypothetical protein
MNAASAMKAASAMNAASAMKAGLSNIGNDFKQHQQ